MAAITGTILAGPCDLGSDCRAPDRSRQARYRCNHCARALHGLFCSEVTDDHGYITVQCLYGYGCNIATAGVASHPQECQDSGESDDNESIPSSSEYEDAEDCGATATSTLSNTAEKTHSTGDNQKRIRALKTTGRKRSPVMPYLKIETMENGKQIQTCKACGHQRKSKTIQASRWAEHLVIRCPAVPQEVKMELGKKCKQHNVRTKMEELSTPQELQQSTWSDFLLAYNRDHDEAIVSASPAKKKAKVSNSLADVDGVISTTSTTINIRTDYCDQARADAISLAIMSFLTGCALPFVLIESNFFISMLRSLNATYVDKFLTKADTFVNKWLPMLYDSVKLRMSTLWKTKTGPLRTVGIDGFTTEIQEKVFMVSEYLGDLVSFKELVVQDESHATGEDTGHWMIDALVKATIEAGGTERDVENFYAAVVGDNNVYANVAGAQIMQERFPRVFFNGCRSHCADLLCKDICQIPAIKSVLDQARFIAELVQGHASVKAAFERIMENKKGSLVPMVPPQTRFTYADILCSTVIGGDEEANIGIYQILIKEPGWLTNTLKARSREKFERIVTSTAFYRKVRVLRELTGLLCKAIHDMESSTFRASYVMPMFLAIERDVENWCESTEAALGFDDETRQLVLDKVHCHWEGQDDVAGLKTDHYLLATILDPYTSPSIADLPCNWLQSCSTVLERFYKDQKLDMVETEINRLVAGEGSWGDYVSEIQSRGYRVPFETTIDRKEPGFYIDAVLAARKGTLGIRPDLVWRNSLQREFPLLYEVARRVLVMSTQSADVERLCKAQKVIHTTVRDRLKNATVLKLVYCYINLHLLKSNECKSNDPDDSMVNFLEQSILDHLG